MPFRVRVLIVKHSALYEELTHVSSIAFHFLEPLDGGSGGSGAEMQEIGQFFLVEGLDFSPEPLNYFVFGVELALVVCVFPPILDINVGHSIEDHFKFIGLKYAQQILGNDLIDTVLYSCK